MKRIVLPWLAGAGLVLVGSGAVLADTYNRGYMRRDGTYVAPHYQSSPNRSYNDNWSTQPNLNPYSGRMGTNAPTLNDRPPPSPFGSLGTIGPSYSPRRSGYR